MWGTSRREHGFLAGHAADNNCGNHLRRLSITASSPIAAHRSNCQDLWIPGGPKPGADVTWGA